MEVEIETGVAGGQARAVSRRCRGRRLSHYPSIVA
jgi:hypothetical protein